MFKDKGLEIMKDLAAGKPNSADSAFPFLNKKDQKGFMEMVRSFGLEEHVFDRFGRDIIHGRKPDAMKTGADKELENAARSVHLTNTHFDKIKLRLISINFWRHNLDISPEIY